MPSLKELSIFLGLLSSDMQPVSRVDGWVDYVWRVRSVEKCQPHQFCELVQDRWDWKRPQFYNFAIIADPVTNTIRSQIRLINNDPSDIDHVCIVASFLDRAGREIGILYVNWKSYPRRDYRREVPITPLTPVSEIASVAVGSKQCPAKNVGDANNFQRIRTLLQQR